MRTPTFRLVVALALVALLSLPAAAHLGGLPGTGGEYIEPPDTERIEVPRGERPCPNENPEWRAAQTVEGVEVSESLQCEPDNPELVAAFVKGTNHMPRDLLDRNALHQDAVVKTDDLDGDGDPDRIHIRLEVAELNGWHLKDDILAENFSIGPGIAPTFWVFAPKSTIHHSGPFFDLVRMPSPVIRVEQGDEVKITLENTHYFPHTIHLHGVDHPFVDANGEGNDGVPLVSEMPLKPGETRTYEITPRVPGTFFYHCHVQPDVHVLMGLAATLIVEEARPNNTLMTFNVGASDVRHRSQAVREAYDREYDLVYMDIDKDLNLIPQTSNDPRVVSRRMHNEHDTTERHPDYFLLNGRLFPYTLRESVIVVDENETVKLRIINSGSDLLSLHTHGHKMFVTHLDGVPLPNGTSFFRDTVTLSAAQRVDAELNTTNNGLNAYGPGLWFTHDHREQAVTTDGMNPGGDITIIAYESWLDERTSMPAPNAGTWDMFFTAEFYRGEIPVFTHLDLDFLGFAKEPAPRDTEDSPLPHLLIVLAVVVAAAALAARGRRSP